MKKFIPHQFLKRVSFLLLFLFCFFDGFSQCPQSITFPAASGNATTTINSGNFRIGNSQMTIANTSAVTFTNTIANNHQSAFGINIAHSGAANTFANRVETTLTFSQPVYSLNFNLNDIDAGDRIRILAYDQNNTLISFGASNYQLFNTPTATQVTYTATPNQEFSSGGSDVSSSDSDLTARIAVNFNGLYVSRFTIQYYDVSSSGSYTIANLTGSVLCANPDSFSGTQGNFVTASVLANDFHLAAAATTSNVSVSTVGTWPAGVTLNANGTISVANTVSSGIYSLNYQICSLSAPGNCSTSTVSLFIIADTDGDGVANYDDLDDDNDGILDSAECPETNTVTNGNFTSNLSGWTSSGGWAFSGGTAQNVTDNAVNQTLSQSLSNLDKPYNGAVTLTLTVGAQDGGNAGGSTASLDILLNNTVYATLNNSTVRTVGTNNVTITMANGAVSNFVPFSTASQNGFTTRTFTISIPYTGPATATLAFRMNAVQDDWNLDDISVPIATCDVDGDGISNHLDLDSDGDGCSDVIEGGANFQSGASYITGNRLNTTVNASGVPAVPTATPAITGYTQAAGQTVAQSQNNLQNDCIDSDADGVPDWQDLDDDNDGILDTAEDSCVRVSRIVNGDFSSITSTSAAPSWAYNYSTTTPNTSGPLLFQNSSVEISVDNPGTLYGNNILLANTSSFNLVSGIIYSFSSTLQIISGTTNTNFSWVLIDSSNNIVQTIQSYKTQASGVGNVTISGTATTYPVSFLSNQTGTYRLALTWITNSSTSGNAQDVRIDNVSLTAPCDSDGDGIPNYLDLDSDGDGCPDVIEGGANFQSGASYITGNRLNTTVNASGVPAVPTATPAITGYTQAAGQTVAQSQNGAQNDCVDSDADGIPDWQDLDDDNDGILDTIEDACETEGTPVYTNNFGTGAARGQDPNVLSHVYVSSGSIGDGFYALTTSNAATDTYSKTNLTGNLDAGNPVITAGSTDGRYLMINIDSPGTVNQPIYRVSNLAVTVGTRYNFRIDMAGLGDGAASIPSLQLSLRDSSGNLLATANSASIGMANDDVWRRLLLRFTAVTSTVTLEIVNLQSNGGGNDLGIDNVVLAPVIICDTDGDGIANSLDLDSDNDGCLDAIEGDENVTTNMLVTAAPGLAVGTGSSASPQNLCATATCINANGVPNIVNSGGAADIGGDVGQGIGDSQNNLINNCYCYRMPVINAGINVPVKHGITALNRAASDNASWPIVRKSAWTVLEAKTKGFVVNRVAFSDADNNPATPMTPNTIPAANFVEGMMVYDTTNNCLKIYNGTSWNCYTTQACPQ